MAPAAPEAVVESQAPAPIPSGESGGDSGGIALSLESTGQDFQLETRSDPPPAAFAETALEAASPPAESSAPRQAPQARVELSLDSSEAAGAIEIAGAALVPEPISQQQTRSGLTAQPGGASTRRVQPGRRERRSASRLILWEPKQLKYGADPMGKGLSLLLDKGAKCALFLSISPPPAGSPVPHFLASAAVAPHDRLAIWTGLKWDPIVAPELWNSFVRSGSVELPPPGTTTNVKSTRNIVRAAFGVASGEWLLLLRAGPPNGCRGVVAVFSDVSLIDSLSAASALVWALPTKAA